MGICGGEEKSGAAGDWTAKESKVSDNHLSRAGGRRSRSQPSGLLASVLAAKATRLPSVRYVLAGTSAASGKTAVGQGSPRTSSPSERSQSRRQAERSVAAIV